MPRKERDAYLTPGTLTLALFKTVDELHKPRDPLTFYEACNGTGAISRVMEAQGHRVITADMDPESPSTHVALAQCEWPPSASVDWAVTNPPFSCGAAILQHQLDRLADGVSIMRGVAILARLSFLEPCVERATGVDRGSIRPPDQLIVLPRTSFTEDGKTDSVTCGWMVWYGPRVRAWTGKCIQVVTRDQLKMLAGRAAHKREAA